ncbi:MAG: radical SAM protein [Gallionella sp.]|nr:radical SAM protein [Gallionella sp.]
MLSDGSLTPQERRQLITHALSPRRLELIILPTEQCNFRCTYCYEDFRIGKMRPEVVTGIKNLIGQRVHDLRTLVIQWFGGEPLAAKDIMLDISRHARRLCTENGVRLLTIITTNASLLRAPLLDQLAALYDELRFQITLDGDPEQHNMTRVSAGGQGTFSTIWKNLLMMKATAHRFHVDLRLHQGPANEASMVRLIERLNGEFAEDSRFGIYFHEISDLGGPLGGTIPLLSHSAYARRTATLRAMSKVSVRADADSESQRNVCQHICYAAKANAFIIRATGRIGKCTVILGDDRNDIGKINEDGTLSLDAGKQLPWIAGLQTMDMKSLECPLHYLDMPRVGRRASADAAHAVGGDEKGSGSKGSQNSWST